MWWIHSLPDDRTAVFFGASVALENPDSDQRHAYRLVGPDETDAGAISIGSPLARVLLKKRVDDAVTVKLPGAMVRFVVMDIRY